MRSITALILAFILSFSLVSGVHAQTSETIWITSNVSSFKTGETVSVYVNAVSVTAIQGFTFQIRYDPTCLKPVNAASPVQGMNGLSLPQSPGLVDASFASTTPQYVGGVLAEVRFEALGGCQTSLVLESAALAVRNAQGFAAPLPGVKLGESNTIPLMIDSATGNSAEQALAGTPLALDPGTGSQKSGNSSMLVIALVAIVLIAVIGFGIYKVVEKMAPPADDHNSSSRYR